MDVLIVIAPAFAVILTGFFAMRFAIVSRTIADHLIAFAYFICVPSLMFSIVARHPLEGLLGRDGRSRTVSAMAAVIANTGFVSLPLLYAVFGAQGVPPAAIANVVIAALMVPLSIMLLEATGGAGGEAATAARQTLQVLKNPMVWPAILGFAFAGLAIPVPDIVESWLDLLGQGLAPCALFAIGASIRAESIRSEARRILAISVFKLLVMPALILAGGLAMGLDPFLLAAAVVCAASPTANTAYVLSVQYRSQEQSVAAAISATTMAWGITLPLWMLVLAALWPALFGAT